jgi:hypothetical protein
MIVAPSSVAQTHSLSVFSLYFCLWPDSKAVAGGLRNHIWLPSPCFTKFSEKLYDMNNVIDMNWHGWHEYIWICLNDMNDIKWHKLTWMIWIDINDTNWHEWPKLTKMTWIDLNLHEWHEWHEITPIKWIRHFIKFPEKSNDTWHEWLEINNINWHDMNYMTLLRGQPKRVEIDSIPLTLQ